MNKLGSASLALAAAALVARSASAQPQYTAQGDSPQWLKDRRYNEGAGIRAGDLEIHPGVAGEAGYDSNWFVRSNNSGGGIQNTPPIPALAFRITPSLYLSTLSSQRREGDTSGEPPAIAFRAGLNATYRDFIGLEKDANGQDAFSDQRNVGGSADARLDISPGRPIGAALFGSYGRVIQPNQVTADPNLSFTRDDINAGAEIVVQPGGGTLDYHFGYQFADSVFENTNAAGLDNYTHEGYLRGRWRFRPRTALVYDADIRSVTYTAPLRAQEVGLVGSTPVRARIGLNGLVTDRFSVLLLGGWGASFYSTTFANQPQFDSFIGQAELKWFLSASPGIQGATDLGLALSAISVGYGRDFQNSYLGSYYGYDRGYVKFYYFFAGRTLLTLEGGIGAIEYPNVLWPDGSLRVASFTDTRADATLFSEYRFSDAAGVNATVRYTANFSNTQLPNSPPPNPGGYVLDLSWRRLEAYLGLRWFM
jgi:hypothetical protein